jgi:hypothetical protein
MPRRKLLTGLALAGSLAAAILFRRRARRREHLDVYFEDGSMVSLSNGSPGGSTVLPLARRILETANPA